MSNCSLFKHSATIALVSSGAILGSSAIASATSLVPFDQFIQQVRGAQASAFAANAAAPAAFSEMRDHVLKMYDTVQVGHSFLLDDHPYDCVPIMQQPSVRLGKIKTIATAPDVPGARKVASAPQVEAGKDSLGNSIGCAKGAIPMRRLTLEDMTRFKSLKEFFQKGPNGAGQFRDPQSSPPLTYTHKYAHAYSFVTNVGGTVDLNLWNQFVRTAKNEVFSLEQFWYVNTSSTLQTLEMGFQNYPQKYGTTNDVLFIYWTADGYSSTGCYNLDCAGFVQTDPNIHLGGGFSAYSTTNGPQYAPNIEAYFSGGKWFLYYGGGAASNSFGYYPASVYNGGTMATNANEIDYGGETVGTVVWPRMGGGARAAAGFGRAAFAKEINYFNNGFRFMANLTASQPSPSCYTTQMHNNSGASGYDTYFYFGGPGGRSC